MQRKVVVHPAERVDLEVLSFQRIASNKPRSCPAAPLGMQQNRASGHTAFAERSSAWRSIRCRNI